MRFLLVSFVSVVLLYISTTVAGVEFGDSVLIMYLKVIIIFNLLTDGNILLDNAMERIYPTPRKLGLKILIQLSFSVSYAFLILWYFSREFKEDIRIVEQPLVQLMLIFGLFFLYAIITTSIMIRMAKKWLHTQMALETLNQEKIISDYNALQDQLNPHFLFNNLSVLKSMIKFDPEAAGQFTQNFTDVYRYVLQSNKKVLVSLDEEMEFINAFVSLHKERVGEGLIFKNETGEILENVYIPPLTLQLLVENAIKHNIASKESPLIIRIYGNQESLFIENNKQIKESTYSTHFGLKNLKKRFELLSERAIQVDNDENTFKVSVPLFKQSELE
jgi:sensor histidine kinase YesM